MALSKIQNKKKIVTLIVCVEVKNDDKIIKYCIYIVSIIGIVACVAVMFPQVRQIIIELAERILHKKTTLYQEWYKTLLSYATGGICFIAFFDYCMLTLSGKALVRKIKSEIKDCCSEINWRYFIKPVLFMFGIYLLGILSIIRGNFLYLDDVGRTCIGYRGWYDWSRYVSEFLSVFVHADFHLTDISPLPQLLAALTLAVSSVIVVYVLCDGKIAIMGLLASIPVGLSPYMLECLSYKFDSPYMALSVLASVVSFLFLARKTAFVFCSVISVLVMCMTYQAASGIYILITIILCFTDWNGKRKTNREIFLFLGRAALSFCMAIIIFRLFLMKPYSTYVSNEMLPLPQMFSGAFANFSNYTNLINSDLNFIWKAIIGIIFCFFIGKSVYKSAQNKIFSFLAATLVLCLMFVLSYGVYLALEHPLFAPRAMYTFGVLLAIINIYVAFAFNKIAKIIVLALSWCFFVFAFSYGNAVSDQMRYVNFRATILLQDLNKLYPDIAENKITVQLKNTVGFTPSIKNIAKHNPVICRLVPQMMMEDEPWANYYYLEYFNYASFSTANLTINMKNNTPYVDFSILNLPIVFESYYHTIRSDGKRVLVELNEGMK